MAKPLQTDVAETIHECGMAYVLRSDYVCEPVAEDMLDIGIDIWQGVIPENDIVGIRERANGGLAMIGGIDGHAIDDEGTTEPGCR